MPCFRPAYPRRRPGPVRSPAEGHRQCRPIRRLTTGRAAPSWRSTSSDPRRGWKARKATGSYRGPSFSAGKVALRAEIGLPSLPDGPSTSFFFQEATGRTGSTPAPGRRAGVKSPEGFAPPCSTRFRFRAEPPLPLPNVDPGSVIIALPWNRVDALPARTDVTFDSADARFLPGERMPCRRHWYVAIDHKRKDGKSEQTRQN